MSSLNINKKLGPFFSGTQLFMSPEDIELASIVYNSSLEELSLSFASDGQLRTHADDDDSDDADANDDPKIELSRRNLERISKLFETASDARKKFLKNFKMWETLRQENIKQLKDLIGLMREEKKKCTYGLLAGGAATLIGGAAITGAFLFPPAAPALLPAAVSAYIPAALLPTATAAAAYLPSFLLPAAAAAPAAVSGAMAGGMAAAGLGGATIAGSTAALIALRERRLEEVRDVIKADELAFTCVKEWFRHTQELITATEELIGFDAIEEWVNDLSTALSWSKNLPGQLIGRRDLFTAGIKLCILRLLPVIGTTFPGFGAAFIASFLTFLFCVYWLNHRALFRLVSSMRSLGGRLLPLDLRGLGLIPLLGERGAVMGAFAVLGMLCPAALAVLSTLDLKKPGGGQVDPLEKVVDKLQEELDILKEVFASLVSG